jgi:hypothetical protein
MADFALGISLRSVFSVSAKTGGVLGSLAPSADYDQTQKWFGLAEF